MKVKPIYEDDSLIVCLKPAGVTSQKSNGAENMIDILNGYFRESGENAEAYPVHRLDKETSGLTVFAKDRGTAAALSALAAENGIKKRYYAIIKGTLNEKSGVLTDWLFRDANKNKSYVVNGKRKGVRYASLEYELLSEKNGLSLLDVLLHTGRTHQIRVQFSSRGTPLLGDGRYGGGKGSPALFARSLAFVRPAGGEKLYFSETPDLTSPVWSVFADEILSRSAETI